MPDPSRVPILVLSFDRPDYLTETLESLRRQQGVAAAAHPTFLFQDGGRNRFSGATYCSDAVLLHNVDLFRRLVPHGVPLPSYLNLGIALNFARAERFAFEELDAEVAIFLEDDLVLGPWYLKTLNQLVELALQDERVGYVAAYGDPLAKLAEQRARPSALVAMSHDWGFALTRRQWRRQKPLVDEYLAIVAQQDYRLRDHDRIIDLFHKWGLGVPGTSQDIAKSHACILLGAAKVNTYACFARYIGRQGMHFTDANFEELGFSGTETLEEDLFRLVPPTEAELSRMATLARGSAMQELVQKSTPPLPGQASGECEAALGRLRFLFSEGRFDEAETLCVEWLARAPQFRDHYNHPAYLKELTRLALARGRLGQARELADRLAAAVAPADPCVNVLFARAYKRMGASDAALAEWHAVLAKDPDNTEAQQEVQDVAPAPHQTDQQGAFR